MPPDSSSVLQHVVAILDCFSPDHPELGVREVARLANLSTSTAGRLMAEMRLIGILQQNSATRGYALGARILAWSGVYMDALDLRTVALPIMEDLRRASGETITLYLLDGNERLCVERMESRNTVRMVSRVGRSLPLYAGAAGKAILAYLPPERVDEFFNTVEPRPLTPHTLVEPAALRAELAHTRKRGYAVSDGEWIIDAAGVAAPIFNKGGEVVGSVSISGPSSRFTASKIQQYAADIVQAAGQISQFLGCSTYKDINRVGE
jgi:IclR family transcriptional regulator, KDG regulon repressor